MSAVVIGPVDWSLERSDEGYRDYNIDFLVKSEVTDTPQAISEASGLPAVGSIWNFNSQIDPYAQCSPYLSVSRANRSPDGDCYWSVKQKFTTRPLGETVVYDDPLSVRHAESEGFAQMACRFDRDALLQTLDAVTRRSAA